MTASAIESTPDGSVRPDGHHRLYPQHGQ